MNKAILKAIKIFKSQQALAAACGVSQNAVSKWLNGGSISLENALKIEKATNGKVKAEMFSKEFSSLLARNQETKKPLLEQRLVYTHKELINESINRY